jgi:hypothetical protein
MAISRISIWDRGNKTAEGSPQLHSGANPNTDYADGSIHVPTDMTATENIQVNRGGTYRPLAFLIDLASAVAGFGSGLIGYQDANDSLVAADVEAALDELSTPLTLTPGAEVGDVLPIVVAGPAHVAQYQAEVLDDDMLLALVAAFHLAETGVGAEVSTTARPSLLFTTDATGAATISCTDVIGASGETKYVRVTPMSASAGTKAGPATIVPITFD